MYNLKEFRNYIGLTQTDVAEMFGCSQPNIAKSERLFSDLTVEQSRILKERYGEEIVNRFVLTSPPQIKKVSTANEDKDFDWRTLVAEQQKSINDLINMVKLLQDENKRLTDLIK